MLQKTALDTILKRIKTGGVRVTYWDGDTRIYGNLSDPALHVRLNDPAIVAAMAKNTSLAIGEGYMNGTVEVDGPLDELAELAFKNQRAFDLPGTNRLHKHNRNVKSNQPRLIGHHYDLGNDFYQLWLDKETLGYTCSYYKTPHDTLEDGQRQKFDHVLNKLRLEKGHELLDIGFGWGYLLIRAAKRFGVKGFGVSLSREQLKFARAWAKREGVDHLVTYELMNYQDLPKLKRQFDRIVSIGFFEHVGQGHHRTYFDIVGKLLKNDGVSVLHCITQLTEAPPDAWMDRYIFPGGYIPSAREVTAYFPEFNFVIKDYENIGPHYIATLEEWWQRFELHKEEIISKYDERFYRMWRFYLAGSISGFRSGVINLSQWTFTRIPSLDWPLTREYLYK
jgi:cyclopropane-fatty-acyl-phospholipid synthase